MIDGMERSKRHSLISLLFILNCLSKTLVITISNCATGIKGIVYFTQYSQFLLIKESQYTPVHLDTITNRSNDSFKNNNPELPVLNEKKCFNFLPNRACTSCRIVQFIFMAT